MIETKISKGFKVTIPSELRKEFSIEETDKIQWSVNENNRIEIVVKKKKSLKDVIGFISDEEMDSVLDSEKAGMGDDKL